MAGSKKGEFVILGAKKVHYGIEKPKFTFITGEKKLAWWTIHEKMCPN